MAGTSPAMTIAYSQSSPHRRNDELGTFLDARGPARRHRLGLGVEAHRVRAVLVEIAETRTLPAAESVIGKRHGDREIHSDHAHFDPADEVARGVAVPREDGDAVAVFVLGGKPHRLLVVLGAHYRQHRPENLFLVDAHVGRDMIEQTTAHEMATLIALQLEVAAVDQELG